MAVNISVLKEFYKTMIIQNNVASTKTLYTRAKSGKIRIWTGFVRIIESENIDLKDLNSLNSLPLSDFDEIRKTRKEPAITYTCFQSEGGKLTTSKPTIITEGKNIGKKNETTPFLQALQKLMSDVNKKLKKGAKLEAVNLSPKTFDDLVKEGNYRVNVMTLHDVNKGHWNKIKYPCFIQPKLDGIHLVAVYVPSFSSFSPFSSFSQDEKGGEKGGEKAETGKIDLFLRGITKKIGQNHIRKALEPILSLEKWRGFYITGEMFTPGLNRQTITSAITAEDSVEKINFNVFDIFNIDKPLQFHERYKLAVEFVREVSSPYVKIVKAKLVHNREEINKYFEEYLKSGYEGAVLRNYNGLYEFGLSREVRSFDTMKLKNRDDFEFEICGYKQGIGKNKGLIIFIAKTNLKFIETYCPSSLPSSPNGEEIKEFAVSPSWPEEERKKKYLIGESFIGKMATISFDSVSNECIPVQPVLIMIH